MTRQHTHLRVLELGPQGGHILGQFDGLALRLAEQPRDTLHFVLRVQRHWLVATLSQRSPVYSRGTYRLRSTHELGGLITVTPWPPGKSITYNLGSVILRSCLSPGL